MRPLSELTREAENYFVKAAAHKAQAEQSYEYILHTIDDALQDHDTDSLLSLVSYIEHGEGQYAFQYIGKTQRLLCMLNIISLEMQYGQTPLFHDCVCAKELWEKYMLTLFSLRRLMFHLSAESVSEAVFFLQNHLISYLAAYVITLKELPPQAPSFYEQLAEIYSRQWSEEEIRQFFILAKAK